MVGRNLLEDRRVEFPPLVLVGDGRRTQLLLCGDLGQTLGLHELGVTGLPFCRRYISTINHQ